MKSKEEDRIPQDPHSLLSLDAAPAQATSSIARSKGSTDSLGRRISDTLASRDWNADLTVEEGLFQMLLVGNSPSSTVRSASQSLEGLVFCEPSCTENQYL